MVQRRRVGSPGVKRPPIRRPIGAVATKRRERRVGIGRDRLRIKRTAPKPLTEQEIQFRLIKERDQQIQDNLDRLAQTETELRQQLDQLSRQQETESIARQKDQLSGQLSSLGEARKFISEGGDIQQAINFIRSRGEGVVLRAEQKSRLRKEGFSKSRIRELTSRSRDATARERDKLIQLGREAGLDVTLNDKTGSVQFSDPNSLQSVSIAEAKRRADELSLDTPVKDEVTGAETSELPGGEPIISEIRAREKPEGFLEGTLFELQEKRSELRAKTSKKRAKGESTFKEEFLGLGIGASSTFLQKGVDIKEFLKDPAGTTEETAKGLKSLVTEEGVATGLIESGFETLFEEPGFALGSVGAEVTTDIAIGKGLGKLEDLSKIQGAKATGKFRTVEKVDDISIVKVPTSTKISIGENIGDLTTLNKFKPASVVDDVKTIKLLEKGEGFDLSPPKAVKLAGTKTDAISTSTGFFDNIQQSKLVLKKGEGLEKSLFADPLGRARTSRLGLTQKQANALDIISGDITLKRTRPQILAFFDTEIETFPSNLKDVVKKIERGKPLTKGEQAKLLKFQSTPSGKFKPLGFVSSEAEITLAPGEIAFKKGLVGVTQIDGRPIEIFSVGIKQASPKLTKLQTKGLTQPLSESELIELTKLQKLESGLSSVDPTSSFVSPASLGSPLISGSLRTTKKEQKTSSREESSPKLSLPSFSKSTIRKGRQTSSLSKISRIPTTPTPRVRRRPEGSSKLSLTKAFSGSSVGRTSPSSQIVGFPLVTKSPRRFQFKQTSKKQQGLFLVRQRRQGKFRAIGTRKTLSQAFALGKSKTDTSLGATFNIVGLGRGLTLSGLQEDKKFKRKRRRDVSGITFVEAPKFRLDTPQELLEIQASKRKKKKK